MDNSSSTSIDFSNNNLNHSKSDFLMISNEIIIDTTPDLNSNKRKYEELYDESNNSNSSKLFKLYDNQNIYLQSTRCVELCLINENLTKCRDCLNSTNTSGGGDGIENCRFIGWRKLEFRF